VTHVSIVTTEEVAQWKLTALSLESIDDVEGSDGLALGVLSVCDSVADDTLEEGLEDTAGLLVDHGRDTLDTATACETADSGLGDTLDVVAKNLPVALGSALAETLATFAACREDASVECLRKRRRSNSCSNCKKNAGRTYVQSC
jgi:hypothetical protein